MVYVTTSKFVDTGSHTFTFMSLIFTQTCSYGKILVATNEL